MRDAHDRGARLVHFGEGATCWPDKRLMSVDGPDPVGPSDWGRADWDGLHEELRSIAALARELRLWTVVGAVHRLTPPNRPHNSLYVIDDGGDVVTRYDERMLSNTKLRFLYTPGSEPVTFEVDGVRFGCSLGMEVHFPEIFSEYERLDVDCVLFSTMGSPAVQTPPRTSPDSSVFAAEALAHAATNSYWVSYAGCAQDADRAPSGVISPTGRWFARAPQDAVAAVAVVDLDDDAPNLARPWRRRARAGLYDDHLVRDDPRSADRAAF
jgi:predicted amidohydrolase